MTIDSKFFHSNPYSAFVTIISINHKPAVKSKKSSATPLQPSGTWQIKGPTYRTISGQSNRHRLKTIHSFVMVSEREIASQIYRVHAFKI